jgi:hypothetical protein
LNAHFVNPFAQPGHWFKGCLHVHSTVSDGRLTPEEVIAWYRAHEYHFLAFAEHDIWTAGRTIDDKFITLSALELEGIDPQSGLYHLVGLGMNRSPDLSGEATTSMQEGLNRLRAAGGRVFVAHPYWSGQKSHDLLDLDGSMGIEIYNGGCEVDDAKGYSTVHWDDLLAADRRPWGFAVDDTHWRTGDRDAGRGWVWVKAAELTEAAILEALEAGYFYASCGPEIYDLELDGRQVYVRCSPATAIDFVGAAYRSHRVMTPPGETLTEASYRIRKKQRYVRVACQDAHCNWAWSNPIFLE